MAQEHISTSGEEMPVTTKFTVGATFSSVEILEKEIKKKSRKNLPQQKLHAVLQIRLVLYWSNITEDSIKAEVFRGRISMYSWREEVQIYVKGNETTPVVSVTEVLYNYGHAT